MKEERPNILFIFTDQHRLSAVGCYGDTPCKTPNLDNLAKSGIRFETAYTVCPVCSPARGTIMTGLYPHSHGICSNVHDLGSSVHELPDHPKLLSRRLQKAGYECGCTGKWHLGTDSKTLFGFPNRPSLPRDVGFHGQNFPGHGGGGFGYPEYRKYLAEHGFEHKVIETEKRSGKAECFGITYGVLEGPVESTVPYFLAEHTMGLVDKFQKSGKPFFIWHNFWGPHGPYYSPVEFYDIYRNVEIPEWPNYRWPATEIEGPHQVKLHPHVDQLTWDDWAEAIRHYYAFTSLIDRQIGRMVEYLDKKGLSENTIIIFAADHGETLGSHGGLTDKGWHHFEEIQRVPLIVWMPKRYYRAGTRPGDVLREWISLADIYPTVLKIAGAEFDEAEVHGKSFLPILEGEKIPWRDTIVVEFNGVNSLATSMATVRKGEFKYGWNCSSKDELYDLSKDPYEMKNLIGDRRFSGKIKEMRILLENWMSETNYPGLGMYKQTRLG